MTARFTPRLTAIGSGKGGTGKTLLAVNLAYALSAEGERVLLCDADLGLSNTAVHLGLESGGNLPGVLAKQCGLRDAIVPVLGGAAQRGGFDLLAAAAGSGSLADFDEADAARLVAQLKADRGYDRVLLDLGAGVDASLMHFAAASDEIHRRAQSRSRVADGCLCVRKNSHARIHGAAIHRRQHGGKRRRSAPHRGCIGSHMPDIPQDVARTSGIRAARRARRGIVAPAAPFVAALSPVTRVLRNFGHREPAACACCTASGARERALTTTLPDFSRFWLRRRPDCRLSPTVTRNRVSFLDKSAIRSRGAGRVSRVSRMGP